MKTIIREAVGYTAASACAFVVDVGALWVLVQYCHLWYLEASLVSFLCGLSVAYLLSVRYVFTHHRLGDRKLEFASFAALGGLGLAINAAVIFFAVDFLALNYVAAKCMAAGFTLLSNFVTRRQVLFVKSPAN